MLVEDPGLVSAKKSILDMLAFCKNYVGSSIDAVVDQDQRLHTVAGGNRTANQGSAKLQAAVSHLQESLSAVLAAIEQARSLEVTKEVPDPDTHRQAYG